MPRVILIPPGTNGGKRGLDDYSGAGGIIKDLLDEAIPYTGFEPVVPKYPILAKEALQGVAGACARSIDPHSEADQVAVLLSIIAGFGNLIHQGAFIRMGPRRQYLKEYVVLV